MITINTPPKIAIPMFKDIEPIGILTSDWQFNDCRIQIKNEYENIECDHNEISDYYLIFNHEKIFIQKNGLVRDWPEGGFFDEMNKQFAILFGS